MTACAPAMTLPHTKAVIEAVTVPVIASGGAGAPEHFRDAFDSGRQRRACRHRLPRPAHRHPRTEGVSRLMRDRNAPLTAADVDALAWEKMDGLLPAIVQDARHRPGADARLYGPRRSGRDSGRAASRPSTAARSSGCGRRARPAAIVSRSALFSTDCDDDALLVLADARGPDLPSRHRQLLRAEGGPEGSAGSASSPASSRTRGAADPAESYTAGCSAMGRSHRAEGRRGRRGAGARGA